MSGAWSRWDLGATDAKAASDLGQRPALFVQADGFVEVVADGVPSSRCARALDVFHDGGSVDLELFGQSVDGNAGR